MANIQPASNTYLESARETFNDLETNLAYSRSVSDIQSTVSKIRSNLAKAGVDVAALDETGQSTVTVMEERIKRASAQMHIISARKTLSDFETLNTLYDKALIKNLVVSSIRTHLILAGVDASALDETGQSSVQKMETRINNAVIRANVVSARKRLLAFEVSYKIYDQGEIEELVKTIREHLKDAGKTAAALDEAGHSTEAEMEDRIQNAVVKAHLRSARSHFDDLEAMNVPKDKKSVEGVVQKIRYHLISAGADASALDKTGQSTVQQMEDRVKYALANIHPLARNAFADVAANNSADQVVPDQDAADQDTPQRSIMDITRDMLGGGYKPH